MSYINLIEDGESGASVRSKLNEIIDQDNAIGWGEYRDGTYTALAPFSLPANVDTILPNDATLGIRSELPEDPNNKGFSLNLFDTTNNFIIGRTGDSYDLTIEFKCIPTSVQTTYIDVWIDIGGAVGELYRGTYAFPKGQGQVRSIIHDPLVYTLDTWETNGGTIYIRSNGTCDIYDIRTLLKRDYRSN